MRLPLQDYFRLRKLKSNGQHYVCINCGCPVPELYRRISSTVLKITDCVSIRYWF